MNPLRYFQETSKTRAAKRELFAALKKHRPNGLELPINDDEIAAVATSLVNDHPELTLMKSAAAITLNFRDDLDPLLNPETETALRVGGQLITKEK